MLVAEGVTLEVGGALPVAMGWPGGDAAAEVALAVDPLEGADTRALERLRDDLYAELDLPARRVRCVVGPGPQPYSAALQLACSVAVWPRGGMLIHGAGLALEGRGAVAALAVSGGGKSTLSNLADGFFGLSDETLLLWEGPPARVSGTPFRSTSERVPHARTEALRALLVLEKSPEPKFEKLPPADGAKKLLAQAYQLPTQLASRAELFQRAAHLAQTVPTYRFAFPKSAEAATLLRRLYDEELR